MLTRGNGNASKRLFFKRVAADRCEYAAFEQRILHASTRECDDSHACRSDLICSSRERAGRSEQSGRVKV